MTPSSISHQPHESPTGRCANFKTCPPRWQDAAANHLLHSHHVHDLLPSCEQKIPDDDRGAVHLRLRYQQFELCGRCSGAIIEMLKDMRLIKELDTIR